MFFHLTCSENTVFCKAWTDCHTHVAVEMNDKVTNQTDDFDTLSPLLQVQVPWHQGFDRGHRRWLLTSGHAPRLGPEFVQRRKLHLLTEKLPSERALNSHPQMSFRLCAIFSSMHEPVFGFKTFSREELSPLEQPTQLCGQPTFNNNQWWAYHSNSTLPKQWVKNSSTPTAT